MASGDYTEIATAVTQECNGGKGFWGELHLPRLEGGEEVIEKYNEMVQQVEDRFNLLNRNDPIVACVTNGAIVIDCNQGGQYEVDLTTDVNSITFKNCNTPGKEVNVRFRNIGTVCVDISGWPAGVVCSSCGSAASPTELCPGETISRDFGMNRFGTPVETNDTSGGAFTTCFLECVKAAISGGGGVESAIVSCGESCQEGAVGGGGGGGAEAGLCECAVDDIEENLLKVEVCTELNCEDTAPKLELRVCGGVPPYEWAINGGDGALSGYYDNSITVTPKDSVNNFEGTEAFRQCYSRGTPFVCEDSCGFRLSVHYDCDGVLLACSNPATDGVGCPGCVCEDIICCDSDAAGCAEWCPNIPVCDADTEQCPGGSGSISSALKVAPSCAIERRTQAMIDDGCNPCVQQMDGVTVTVTDKDGTQVTTIITTST